MYNYGLTQDLNVDDFGVVDYRIKTSGIDLNDLGWYAVEFIDFASRPDLVIWVGHRKYSYGTTASYWSPIYRLLDYGYVDVATSDVVCWISKAFPGSET